MADTQETPTAPVSTPYAALRAEVAARIATSQPDVREIVIIDLTKAEIERRATAVKAVVAKIDAQQKEIKKAENAGKYAYTAQGEKVGDPVFTKEEAEALNKMRSEVAKLQAALGKAFDEGDFGKVLELGK